MAQTVVGFFHTPAEADHAVADLVDSGFGRETIRLILPGKQAEHIELAGSRFEHAEDMAIGGVGGGLFGAMIGVLVGMVLMALPGFGGIGSAAATMVAGGLLGAVGGAIVGALAWGRITRGEAQVYEHLVQQGGALVALEAEAGRCAQAAAILRRDGAAEPGEIEAEWRREGLL